MKAHEFTIWSLESGFPRISLADTVPVVCIADVKFGGSGRVQGIKSRIQRQWIFIYLFKMISLRPRYSIHGLQVLSFDNNEQEMRKDKLNWQLTAKYLSMASSSSGERLYNWLAGNQKPESKSMEQSCNL